MKLLLDTHIILWAAGAPEKLSESTRTILTASENSLFFSAASIWEIVIKLGLGREDFKVDPYLLRKKLVLHGYTELPITAEHALRPLHNCIKPTILSFPRRRESSIINGFLDTGLRRYDD